MSTATALRTLPWDNDATLYELTPPLPNGVTHVIASTTVLGNGTTGTLVLAATEDGQVAYWIPLTASLDGDASALAQLGYEVRS
ncbi:hypothetical protein GCM10009740_31710 [Terrabacter terrae]|uniref:Uncharacterized protein n=1 Tax=Terrabacter terrae TaxID=318434 RepID=A0ABN2UHV0_9MICO